MPSHKKTPLQIAVQKLNLHLVDTSRITHVDISSNSPDDDCATFLFWNSETVTGFEVYLNDLEGEQFEVKAWWDVYTDDHKQTRINASEVFNPSEYKSPYSFA
jgi:hypothetical protein